MSECALEDRGAEPHLLSGTLFFIQFVFPLELSAYSTEHYSQKLGFRWLNHHIFEFCVVKFFLVKIAGKSM